MYLNSISEIVKISKPVYFQNGMHSQQKYPSPDLISESLILKFFNNNENTTLLYLLIFCNCLGQMLSPGYNQLELSVQYNN